MTVKLESIFIFFMKGKIKDKLITLKNLKSLACAVVKIVRGDKFSTFTPRFCNTASNTPCTTELKA